MKVLTFKTKVLISCVRQQNQRTNNTNGKDGKILQDKSQHDFYILRLLRKLGKIYSSYK